MHIGYDVFPPQWKGDVWPILTHQQLVWQWEEACLVLHAAIPLLGLRRGIVAGSSSLSQSTRHTIGLLCLQMLVEEKTCMLLLLSSVRRRNQKTEPPKIEGRLVSTY